MTFLFIVWYLLLRGMREIGMRLDLISFDLIDLVMGNGMFLARHSEGVSSSLMGESLFTYNNNLSIKWNKLNKRHGIRAKRSLDLYDATLLNDDPTSSAVFVRLRGLLAPTPLKGPRLRLRKIELRRHFQC